MSASVGDEPALLVIPGHQQQLMALVVRAVPPAADPLVYTTHHLTGVYELDKGSEVGLCRLSDVIDGRQSQVSGNKGTSVRSLKM